MSAVPSYNSSLHVEEAIGDEHYERIERAFISRHWRWTFNEPAGCPATVLDLLTANLRHIDPASWPKRLAWGGLFYNGIPTSADRELTLPCQVEYYEPKFEIDEAQNFFPGFAPEQIVFEDEDLLVAFKPAGLPCMPAREQVHYNLKTYLENYCGHVIHMPSRLDMSTQGLVITSKSARMHAPLQQLFERREIRKTYLLECAGRPDWKSRVVENFITKDERHPVLRRVDDRSGRRAVTIFDVMSTFVSPESGVEHSIIMARPLTGRTHQIRVHISSVGFPICGDNFYDGPQAAGLRLLSYALEFCHPLSGQFLDLRVPDRLLPRWAHTLPGSF